MARPARPLSTLRRPPYERPTHDSGSWLVASLYHVEDLHLPIHAGFYRRFLPVPLPRPKTGAITITLLPTAGEKGVLPSACSYSGIASIILGVMTVRVVPSPI
jgi:hypothetical protein